jgi:hypothetical protein
VAFQPRRTAWTSSSTQNPSAQWLYLGTYGWNVWHTVLSPPVPDDPVDVFVNGKVGLQLKQFSDENSNPLIPPEKFSLDVMNLYVELAMTNQQEYMTTMPVLMLQLQLGLY